MKTHVAISTALCPICLREQEAIVLDTKMREVFEYGEKIFAGYELCSECYNKVLAGQVALIEAEGDPESATKLSDISRTGKVVWIDGRSLDVEVPNGFAIVDTETLEYILGFEPE